MWELKSLVCSLSVFGASTGWEFLCENGRPLCTRGEGRPSRGVHGQPRTLCADSTHPPWVPWLCAVPLLDAVHTAVCRKSSRPNCSIKWLVLIHQGHNPRTDHTKWIHSCQELGAGWTRGDCLWHGVSFRVTETVLELEGMVAKLRENTKPLICIL